MNEPALIATFYSYKGGVGRSFALANVAVVLAQWGMRVLAVDWDIEAPGLSHYFRPMLGKSVPGVVDFLEDCRNDAVKPWQDYVQPVDLPACEGQLSLMPAVGDGGDFKRILQEVDWDGLYEQHNLGEHLERSRAEWSKAFDIVLIDSRTGVTDFSGITTAQLPDILLFFFTANRQSLEGCCDVVERAMAARKQLPIERSAIVPIPVPSRFETRDEYDRAIAWRSEFAKVLKPFFDVWVPAHIEPRRMVDTLIIPYVPRWSFGEDLAVLTELASPGGVRSASYPISFAIETLAALFATRLRRVELLADSRDEFVLTAKALASNARRAQPAEKANIFLSFSASNVDIAERFRKGLIASGFDVSPFVGMDTHVEWSAMLEKQIELSDAIVVLVGRTASKAMERELEQFQRSILRTSKSRLILPVILPDSADAPMARRLRETMRVYEWTESETFDGLIYNLVTHIQRVLDPEAAKGASQKTTLEVERLLKASARRIAANSPQLALEAAHQALTAASNLLAADANDVEAQASLAKTCVQTGDCLMVLGEHVPAISNYNRALEIWLRLGEVSRDGEGQNNLARTHEKLGDAYAAWLEPSEAIRHYETAAYIYQQMTDLPASHVAVIVKIGDMAMMRRDFDAALTHYSSAFEIVKALAASGRRDNNLWREQARIGEKIGDAFSAIGKLKEARATYQRAEEVRRRLVQSKPGNALWQGDLAQSLRNMAEAAAGQGDLTVALANYEESIAIRQRLSEAFPNDLTRQAELASALADMGGILRALSETRTAVRHYERALEIQQTLLNDDPSNLERMRAVSSTLVNLGGLLGSIGDDVRERDTYERLQKVLERLSFAQSEYLQDLAVNCRRLGQLYLRRGDLSAAEEAYKNGYEIVRRLLKVTPQSLALQQDQVAFEEALSTLGPEGEGQNKLQ